MDIRFNTQCPFVMLNGVPHWIRVWQADNRGFAIGGYKGTEALPHPDLIFVGGMSTTDVAAAKWRSGFSVPTHLLDLAKALITAGEAQEVR